MMSETDTNAPPQAMLIIGSQCPYCPAIQQVLSDLVKQNRLSRLEILNIESNAALARSLNIRSVPWFRIGELEFHGQHSPAELKQWVAIASTPNAVYQYISAQLEAGHIDLIRDKLQQHHNWLQTAIALLGDMQAPLQARIGVGALLEDLHNDAILENAITPLAQLLKHPDHRVRGDACHYLGLCPHRPARPLIESCRNDAHPEVREIAEETLQELPA